MPLNADIGGQLKSIKDKKTSYLSEEQTRHIYKKVEFGNAINTRTLKQEINQERELNSLDDTSGNPNPYRELIVNNAKRVQTILSQMKQWSILSNVVNYIKYDLYPKSFCNLSIKAVNNINHRKKSNTENERQMLELDFGDMPKKLRDKYLDL